MSIFREEIQLNWAILTYLQQDRAFRPNANRNLHGSPFVVRRSGVRFVLLKKANRHINHI